MTVQDSVPAWDEIESKLKRESKVGLIQLIHELTAVSPTAQRYLQTRYLKKKNLSDRIDPYRNVIKRQFTLSEWSNSVSWNFSGVHKAVADYSQSSQGDPAGIGALLVAALEIALRFADNINLQDEDFDAGVTDLAEQCAEHFGDQPRLLSPYVKRLKKAQSVGGNLGYYALVDALDGIIKLD